MNPSTTTPDPRRFSDSLTWLGGADRKVLLNAHSSRSQFVQMGLVVLATAGLAVLSMSFALHIGLDLPVGVAACGGLLWGCIIAVLDRFLVTVLNLRGGWRRVAALVGVRLTIAAMLGFVISTPLVLQVFHDEIQAQMVQDNIREAGRTGDDIDKMPVAEELTRLRKEISDGESVLQGQLAPATSSEVTNRQSYVDKARTDLAELQKVSDQKYRAWQCELYGSSCETSTNVPGNGNLAQARAREYKDAKAQTDAAVTALQDAETALTGARETASAQSGAALTKAQDEARRKLPELRKRANELQVLYDQSVDKGDDVSKNNDGILAQIVALGRLGEGSGAARMTHLAVAGLFFMIEILPVLVKVLMSFGPPTAYERVREMHENTCVDDAKIENRRRTRDRDDEERRIIAEAKKHTDVEDDMRFRERDLGIKANEKVAKEMEGVLDVALQKWARDVQKTLQAAGQALHNGSTAQAGTSTAHVNGSGNSSGTGAAPNTQAVRTNFNMPQGSKLGPVNGGRP